MIKTGKQLAEKCITAAKFKTLYVRGSFGWPMTEESKNRAVKGQAYNRMVDRTAKIMAATADTFGFDCVCFLKAILWGWNADATKSYGGAVYEANGVPDIGEEEMIRRCSGVSEDFSSVTIGEMLWIPGHMGIYIGDGLAVECTHRWLDGVQITEVQNILGDSGNPGRMWKKHGKLPYVVYEPEKKAEDYTIRFPYIRQGDRGDFVAALQSLLLRKPRRMCRI